MSPVPVSLQQVQAIQGAMGGTPRTNPWWAKFKPVRIGPYITRHYGASAVVIGQSFPGLCGPSVEVVARHPDHCLPAPVADRNLAEAVAEGVAEGMRRAPVSVVEPAPWVDPSFRGVSFPQTARTVLNTFGNTNVRTTQVQLAMAGYLGTVAAPIATALVTAGTPSSVLSFQCPDTYKGKEIVVSCQDMEILFLAQWTVTVQGKIVAGPFFLVDGRYKMNVQARRNDTVSLNIIVPTGDAFAVGAVLLIDGYTYPATLQTDGTYNRVMRTSPNWFREEGLS